MTYWYIHSLTHSQNSMAAARSLNHHDDSSLHRNYIFKVSKTDV